MEEVVYTYPERYHRKVKPILYNTNEKGCWLCISHKKDRDNYVVLRRKGKFLLLHRYSYTLRHGSIPDGMVIRHTCDEPSCFNPDHLLLGSQQDNVNDRNERGRTAKGERNGSSKLTRVQVEAIRSDTRKLKYIAADYGVSIGQVSRIRNRKQWK